MSSGKTVFDYSQVVLHLGHDYTGGALPLKDFQIGCYPATDRDQLTVSVVRRRAYILRSTSVIAESGDKQDNVR